MVKDVIILFCGLYVFKDVLQEECEKMWNIKVGEVFNFYFVNYLWGYFV